MFDFKFNFLIINASKEYMAKDEEIIAKIKSGRDKDETFTLLMNKYKERIYWHIRRLVVSNEDAEDILQETFVKVYFNMDKFKGNSSIYTWLYTIATNECGQLFRKRKIITSSYDDSSQVLLENLSSEPSLSGDEVLVDFQKAILSLPEKQRLVFNLRYYDELSYHEISEITGQSESTLKTNYHYAEKKVKEYMLNL